MKERLVVITGHSGSGKSTLARQLSEKYHAVYVSKDAIKERIFDAFGTKDKDWSLKVSSASHRLMDDIVEQELKWGRTVIVESNFKPEIDSLRFRKMIQKYNVECLQILCKADPDLLFARWNKRIDNGERHEGHVEDASLEQIRQYLSVPYEPLDLPGRLIEIDTSETNNVILP